MKVTKKNMKALSKEEQKQNQAQRALKRKIRNVFTAMGFTYVATEGHEMKIGHRKIEIDSLFIYENIMILCEDTISTVNIRDHIRTKNEAMGEIEKNVYEFIEELSKIAKDVTDAVRKYDFGRIKIYGLYIPGEEIDLTESDCELFSHLIFVQPNVLNYFWWIAQCIKHSARNELFRFLKVTNADLGMAASSTDKTQIEAPIIYPQSFTGIQNGIGVVSFMMCAEDLLRMCYVLRKDNWEKSMWLYQRLLSKGKISSIRRFLLKNGEAFFNNIIVALPDGTFVQSDQNPPCKIEEVRELKGNCKLLLPKEMNSICVIDGQHRIFAHYENAGNSKQDETIANLRKCRHLLVTGLVFPQDMKLSDRMKIQSRIFLDINSNAKSIPPSVLLQIGRVIQPIAPESIAQLVIEKLNSQEPFKGLLQIGEMDNKRIKTASIVKFALKYLVNPKPPAGKHSLFEFWKGNKNRFFEEDEREILAYAEFCASVLRGYFSAVKKNFKTEWMNPDSKLLSVVSINGLIIALTRQLSVNGVKSFEFYDRAFMEWKFDFSREKFEYTSSQYRRFSNQILQEVFKLSGSELAKNETLAF